METVLFNTIDLSLIITIYQCLLFAAFLLVLKKGKKQSNILLALFLLSQAAIPLDTLINFGEAFRQFSIDFSPNIFYVFGTAYWVEASLLLFYVRSLIYKDYRFKYKDILYILPFIVYVIYEGSTWFFLDLETKRAILQGYELSEEPAYTRAMNLFRECFRVFCSILCLVELRRYQKQIKNEFADIEAVDLSWLNLLVIGFLIIRIQAVLVTLGYISVIELDYFVDFQLIGQISNTMVMFLIAFLIFFSLGFSNLFKGIEKSTTKDSEKESINLEQIESMTFYMTTEKPYLNHLLTLDNLAGQLNLPPRTLSQNINRHFKQNFFEYINSYRIEESKRLLSLEENSKATMLDIMDKAGFNSKATFNTFFKKIVGLTPTQFKKDNKLQKDT